ncbi:Glu-tRNAGln amidotransferase C subunit [Sesbania bispinosa]|nr:Glu-tRNAGln amidotransferase C subunit [Sesbania bispinosa]
MGSRGLVMLRGASLSLSLSNANGMWHRSSCFSFPQKLLKFRSFSSTTTCSSIQPPDVEEFAPKIQQVIDWFGQLQDVDLQSIEPSIRADNENNLRDNAPETFENRDAMIASVPSYEEPYIKVPKVLSMD